MIEVFSSGGGTQSSAIAALIAQGKLPRPDIFVIADTSRECSATWKYLDEVVSPAMISIGLDVHRIKPTWAYDGGIWDRTGKHLQIGAWSNQNGKPGKLTGFCSSQWKTSAIDRYLSKRLGLTRSKYRKWIGFSFDEWRRAQRIMAGEEGRKGLIWLPLVTELRMKRRDSVQVVKDMGWPEPPRSRCWMCPNQSDREWHDLKVNYPDEFLKAADLEMEIQQSDPHAWLHKSCKPLAEVDLEPKEGLFDPGIYCNSGVCFV